MNNELRRLISESRQYIAAASPQKKLRLLQLIKRAITKLRTGSSKNNEFGIKSVDYVEEK